MDGRAARSAAPRGGRARCATTDASRELYAADASIYRRLPVATLRAAGPDDLDAAVAACREDGVPLTMRGAGTSLGGPGRRRRPRRRLLGARVDRDRPRGAGRPGRPGRGARRPQRRGGRPRARLRPRRRLRQPGDARRDDRQQLRRRPLDRLRPDRRPRPRPRGDAGRRDARDAPARRPRRRRRWRRPGSWPRPRGRRRLLRRVSGYALGALAGDEPDWPRLLCGSEGTLAVIRGAEVALVERPAARGLALLSFPSVDAALEATPSGARGRARRPSS